MRCRTEADLSSVLDLIYQAPLARGGWEAALTAICDFTAADCADLSMIDTAAGWQFVRVETARIDTAAFGRYLTEFMQEPLNTNPRVPECRKLAEGQMFSDSQVWRPAQRDAQPFFHELMRPLGLNDALLGMARTDPERHSVLLAIHSRERGAAHQQRELLRMLLPHVRRAVETDEKLQVARRENAALSDALDHAADAVALVTISGRVTRSNRPAHDLLRAGAGLGIGPGGQLTFEDGAAQAAFQRELANCAAPAAAAGATRRLIARSSHSTPLVLTLHRLPAAAQGAFGAVALLFIGNPGRAPSQGVEGLRLAFRLSPGEARIAMALSEGLLLREIAQRNGVTYETVRTQLRRLMDKTGSRRQADLVRLVRDFG